MAEPIDLGGGKWMLRVFVNKTPDGQRVRHRQQVTFEADGIRRARAKARDVEAKVAADYFAGLADPTPTVAEVANNWWDLWSQRNRSPTTRKGYRSILDNHLLNAPFAEKKIDEVTTGEVERWYASLFTRGLSPSTVTRVHASVVSPVFDQAVKDGKLGRNPTTLAYKPENRAQAKPNTPIETVMLILEAAQRRHPMRARMLAFAALTGLRRGELCGVRWSGLELDQGALIVEHNIVVAKERFMDPTARTDWPGLVLKGPKAHQIAAIALSERAIEIVHQQQESQRLAGASMTDKEKDDREGPFLWSTKMPFDHPLHPDTATNWFTQAASDAGVRGVSLHDLRHWKASQTLEVGGTIEDVRAALRHRSLATSFRYVHADTSKQRVLVDLLPRLELPSGAS